MKVRIFDLGLSVDLRAFEAEINNFLASLPKDAVKHVQDSATSTRTRQSDQMETDYFVTVWYEGEPARPSIVKPAEKLFENPAELFKPAEKTSAKPPQRAIEKPAQKPAKKSDKKSDKPAKKPTKKRR